MKTRREPIFNWALWAGIAIWVVSLVGILLAPIAPNNSSIKEDIMEYGWIKMLVVNAIIVPLLEETCFRFWCLRRWHWTGYVSAAGIGFCSYFLVGTWAVAIALIIAAITWLVKNDRTKLLILLVLTSFLFAIMHYNNHGNLQLQSIFALTNHFGYALIAAWLILNRGFLWAVLLHGIINSLVVGFTMAGICLSSASGITVGTSFTVETGWSVWLHSLDRDIPRYEEMSPVYTGTLPSIAAELLASDSTATITFAEGGERYEILIRDSTGIATPIQVVREMEQNAWITLDTLSQEPLRVHIENRLNLDDR